LWAAVCHFRTDPTIEYWNAMMAPGDPDFRMPEWRKEWPALFRTARDELAALPTTGVHTAAVGTAHRSQAFLEEVASFIDHLNWTNEHPIQTALSGTLGGNVHSKWQIKAQECKRLAIEYNSFASKAYEELCREYGSEKLHAPVLAPVGSWDEHILQAQSEAEALGALPAVGAILLGG